MKKLFLNKKKQGKANVMFSLMTALAAASIALFCGVGAEYSRGAMKPGAYMVGAAILGFFSGYLFIFVASMEEKERTDG